MYKILFSVVACYWLIGCAAPKAVPIKSNLNDFVANGMRTNSKDTICYTFDTPVKDTVYVPFGKDKSENDLNKTGYVIHQKSSFQNMAKSFVESKFSNLSATSNNKVSIQLSDFYLELYSTSGKGAIATAALIGGEISYVYACYVKTKVTITKDGQEQSKIIIASSEQPFVQGIGTGTATSNIYQGENAPEFKLAKAIDDANNKAMMFIGKFLDEQQL